jgi:hypothetical protein
MICWNVERFVQRIVNGVSPGGKVIRASLRPPADRVVKPEDARSVSVPAGHLLPPTSSLVSRSHPRVRSSTGPAAHLRGYQLDCAPPEHPVLLTGLRHERVVSPFALLEIVYSSPLLAVAVTEYSIGPPLAALT